MHKSILESKAKLSAVGLVMYAVLYQWLYMNAVTEAVPIALTGWALFGIRDAV